MSGKRLLIKDLVSRIEQGLHSFDIHDEVHYVMIYRGGKVYDARVDFEKRVLLPDGRTQRAYGLIFSEAEAETLEPGSVGSIRGSKAV